MAESVTGYVKVSVIIPAFNTSSYVGRCLDSVTHNDYANLEIICVNDGSTDNTLEILREYEHRDSRIKVIDCEKNHGVSHARNTALDSASGDYIAFVDSDDCIHREYFSTMVKYALQYDSDITVVEYIRTQTIPEDTVVNDHPKIRFIKEKTLIDRDYYKYFVSARIYHRRCVKDIRFPESIKNGEDNVFNIGLFCAHSGIRTILIDCVMYYYFVRPDSIVGKHGIYDYRKRCLWYLERAEQTTSQRALALLMTELFRKVLFYRNLHLTDDDTEIQREIEYLVRETLLLERKKKPFWVIKSSVYRLLMKRPRFYKWLSDKKALNYFIRIKCKLYSIFC